MAFSFSTRPIVVDHRFDNCFQKIESAEEMLDALTTMKTLDEALASNEEIAENIEKSLVLLKTYGASAIKQLNLDKGLENLLHKPEASITVAMATEGLSEALSAVKDTLKDLYDRYLGTYATLEKMLDKLEGIVKNFDKDALIKSNGYKYEDAHAMLMYAEQALADEMKVRETHDCSKIQETVRLCSANVNTARTMVTTKQIDEETTATKLGYDNAEKCTTITRQAKAVFAKLTDLNVKEKGELKARILSSDDKAVETMAKRIVAVYYAQLGQVVVSAIYRAIALMIKFCDGKKKEEK